MEKNKTVLVGIITAMILSSSNAYADDGVKNFYKYIAQTEVSSSESEIFTVMEEVLQKDVDNGRITKQYAQQKLDQLKTNFKS